ncbi:MAG: NAD-dependent epimerase/dehydratase family protein [Candidatus Thermoplasmatota archaeon]|nr:NAD-dependent epimerase/dehydratase family protein [Candidatus Thermoplasmatota archaeon]
MKALVTGGAGFIGSCLVKRLVGRGDEVVIYDNLSSGRIEFIEDVLNQGLCQFIKADLLDFDRVKEAVEGVDMVWHIAANPDIRMAEVNTRLDMEQGVAATYNVLEAMRLTGVKKIAFSSSSVVYGEASVIPTPEDYGPLVPISLYAGSKLGAEGLISSFCGTFGLQSWMFRFANVIGSNSTHGVIYDFTKKLLKDPSRLEILGNGKQAKSYLMVEDCVDAMLYAVERSDGMVNIFNLGADGRTNVTRIAEIVVDAMGLKDVSFEYTGTERGWAGDVRQMALSIDKMKELGWSPGCTSDEAVKKAAAIIVGEVVGK